MKDKIVFFGNGPVAYKSLMFLYEHFEIEAVIAKPRSGRNDSTKLVPDFAKAKDLSLLLPTSKKELTELIGSNELTSRVGVVVDYGLIIPRKVFESFELGIVNSHFSLLPEWRGADPITFSLLSGQDTTGVSIMKIVENLDEGQLLSQSFYDIPKNETIKTLTENLVDLSNQMLLAVLPTYLKGQLQLFNQDDRHQKPTFSRKLAKQDGVIDWQKPAKEVEREIRAFLDWPSSKTTINSKEIAITKAKVTDDIDGINVGDYEIREKRLYIKCGEGSLEVLRLKPAGKQEMDANSFLNGLK